jgi:tetratricopeptide (TPR) repeat protein
MRRNFHPWEGGEGKVSGQYITSLVESARRALASGEAQRAIELLVQAQVYPHSLGEGKLYGAQENNIFYYLGCAQEALGEHELAQQSFEHAATGLSEPTSAMFYNDQPPDMIFYQGLANQKLGRVVEAQVIFNRLVDYGTTHIYDDVRIDYFAVSLPYFLVFEKDPHLINRAHCHYMMALGHMGLGKTQTAQQQFAEVLALDANHSGALIHRSILPWNDDQMDDK